MLSMIVSIIAFGLIITIHEFGHFLLAKRNGVGVIEFSVGMGPRILSFMRGNTRYSLKAFPFGGSCIMYGEDCNDLLEESQCFKEQEMFESKTAWQRFQIVCAGPVFNFILVFFLSLIITGFCGYDRPVLVTIDPGMAASEAGIENGDIVHALSCEGNRFKVTTSRDIQVFMSIYDSIVQGGTDPITIEYCDVSDGNTVKKADLVSSYDPELDRYRYGFAYNIAYAPVDGMWDLLRISIYQIRFSIRSCIESLRMLIGGKVRADSVSGPVRIVAVMDDTVESAAEYGLSSAVLSLLNIMMLISGSLGAMNLLPIPALDGGRLVFIMIELITGKRVKREVEAYIHTAGILFLFGLMILIMFNDIFQLFKG